MAGCVKSVNHLLLAVMYVAVAAFAAVVGAFIAFDPLAPYAERGWVHSGNSVLVPILMYHHFADEGAPGTVISGGVFESHLIALRDGGYTAISFQQLLDYVDHGAKLPDRPVVITIDDGYESVYEVAYPLLKQYDMHAAVFIIGVLHGQDLYKETFHPVFPSSLTSEQAAEMTESGVISIQSHSFDMHQYEPYETGPYRRGVMRRRGESEREYIAAFTDDFEMAAAQIESVFGNRPYVYSYPYGIGSGLTDRLLRDMGVRVTLTVTPGMNVVTMDSPGGLFSLRRFNVPGNTSPESLIKMIG